MVAKVRAAKESKTITAGSEQVNVPVLLIRPNPYQPESRLKFAPEVVEKMAVSILQHGLILMPVVRRFALDRSGTPPGETPIYEMADGWLRLAGYRWLTDGKKLKDYLTIPVIVRDLTDQQMADMVMEANTVRQDLNPIEVAQLYKRYLVDFEVTQTQLAEQHNVSQGEIANTLRLLELPADVQQDIIFQKITPAAGRQILRLSCLPKLQAVLSKKAAERSYTVSQLDQEVSRMRWDATKPLTNRSNDGFDIKACQGCDRSIMAAYPWGDQKKEQRCLDPDCYKKKEDAAEKARADKLLKKAGAAAAGQPKVLTSKDVSYSQMEYLRSDTMKNIDNPAECKKCPKRAMYTYDSKPEPVCLNTSCLRAKKSKRTKEVHAVQKKQDQELTAELAKTFQKEITGYHDHFAVIARHLVKSMNVREQEDMITIFPDLSATKKRFDRDKLLAGMMDRTTSQLAQICAAAIITGSRRNGWQDYSIKLEDKAAYDYALLTGSLEQHLKDITVFQEANCRGCSHSKPENIGTGAECCRDTYMRKIDGAKCFGRHAGKAKAGPDPDDEDDELEEGDIEE